MVSWCISQRIIRLVTRPKQHSGNRRVWDVVPTRLKSLHALPAPESAPTEVLP